MARYLAYKSGESLELYYAMSQFSWEKHFSGWHIGFDKQLYCDVFYDARQYHLDSIVLETFRKLANGANGWWYWAPDDNEPRFLTFEEMDDLVWLH